MSFSIVRKVTVTDDTLNASNVAESEAVYNPATTYAEGAVVRGNVPGTAHRTFESLVSGNVGQALSDATKWLATGATNRWKLFDESVQSQTTNADSIAVELQDEGRVDSVTLLNVDAAEVTVVQTDAVDGEVFNETFSLVSTSGITDLYDYCFEPIQRVSEIFISGLFPYTDAVIEVTISDAGGTAKCGGLIIGQTRLVGLTQYGASVGIIDYSRKETNDFGDITVVERSYSRKATYSVYVENDLVDQVIALLAEYRATPVVYIGSPMFGAMINYGFFRDAAVEVTYPTHSILSITTEGLT